MPRLTRKHFPLNDVRGNGLAIGGGAEDLAGYYRREPIKGPGAFVEQVTDFRDFEPAMQRKLIREPETRAIGMLLAPGDSVGEP